MSTSANIRMNRYGGVFARGYCGQARCMPPPSQESFQMAGYSHDECEADPIGHGATSCRCTATTGNRSTTRRGFPLSSSDAGSRTNREVVSSFNGLGRDELTAMSLCDRSFQASGRILTMMTPGAMTGRLRRLPYRRSGDLDLGLMPVLTTPFNTISMNST